MIEVEALTKRYGSTLAVQDLTFAVRPGHVTGFLGPNGSGKSTTMRLVLGLDRPTSGRARVCGLPYRELPAPLWQVGAMLDAGGVHPGRTPHDHLLVLARSNRIPRRRVDEVLAMVGLDEVADRRAGALSLGMHQRLGIAAALLGDPEVLVLDEPLNGLDTSGIRWIRALLGDLAAESRTVLLSSHLMREMEAAADRLVVIGEGRLLAEGTIEALIGQHSRPRTLVRSCAAEPLREVLLRAGGSVEAVHDGWRVVGLGPAEVGDLAARAGIALHELRGERSTLEDVFTRLTTASGAQG